MTDQSDIVILGAGLAGLACARILAEAGQRVHVLDKGRGIGGRMATRRVTLDAGPITFDHGAQYLRPKQADFAQVLPEIGAAIWRDTDQWVGVPGMSDLPRRLATGLHVTQQVEITELYHADGAWQLQSPQGRFHARHLVLTIPAPQARALLGDRHPLADALACVQFAPCLTLLAAFPAGSPRPFVQRRDPDQPLSWIAQDSSKPGRSDLAVTWVAQASPAFSATHLDATKDEIAALLLPHLHEAIGMKADSALHVAAHRWRFAQTTNPLGQPFLSVPEHRLHIGGDWCLGARAEDAWRSGCAIARDILERPDVV